MFNQITVGSTKVKNYSTGSSKIDIASTAAACELAPIQSIAFENFFGSKGFTVATAPITPVSMPATTPTTPAGITGACGSDSGKVLSITPTNLCSAGNPSAINGTGPWDWECLGSGGGFNNACSASYIDPPTPAPPPHPLFTYTPTPCSTWENSGFGIFCSVPANLSQCTTNWNIVPISI